ncbi:hypothetical protein PoB_003955100 [Plakobranchus ocellatus]|uniref:Uncharacterized protein n=1 Tax=Plakobranchus ocellatus TaxID=259542 RepID=A0AAV4APE9_9GAST|nr:hypothetical protein PoB_003955100 [Plakobranchus ocellatus]
MREKKRDGGEIDKEKEERTRKVKALRHRLKGYIWRNIKPYKVSQRIVGSRPQYLDNSQDGTRSGRKIYSLIQCVDASTWTTKSSKQEPSMKLSAESHMVISQDPRSYIGLVKLSLVVEANQGEATLLKT